MITVSGATLRYWLNNLRSVALAAKVLIRFKGIRSLVILDFSS
ncbi:hypothetical protein CCP3SC1AL1_3900002 [Gammaproteobacteria bacterium]